ncbi:MAG: tetratricopeptide repeat protein [Candidatus Kapabacteria bacterium]|nr:tetratricopeptide repeat protein [Candidatus Kapabacteria bacterium]
MFLRLELKKFILISSIFFLSRVFLYSTINEEFYSNSFLEYTKSKEFFDLYLLSLSKESTQKAFNRFSELDNYGAATLLRARNEFYSGNYSYADKILLRFQEEKSNSPFIPLIIYERAFFAFENEENTKAQKLFAQSKKSSEEFFLKIKDSTYIELAHNSLFWNAISFVRQGKYQDAEPLFEECYKKYPNLTYSDDAIYALGIIAEINRDYDKAKIYYRTNIKLYPKRNTIIASSIREINNNIILRDYQTAINNIEQAETVWKQILNNDQNAQDYEKQTYSESASEELLYLKGEAYKLSRFIDRAIIAYSLFLDTFTESKLTNYVRLGIAWCYLNKADYPKAISYYDAVINTEKDNESILRASALLFRAVAMKRAGDVETAKKEFIHLSTEVKNPNIALALIELGQIYFEEGEYEKAVRIFERSEREATEASSIVRTYLLLGESYFELKNWDKAIKSFNSAEQIAMKSSDYLLPQKSWYISHSRLRKGIALVKNNRNGEAIPALLSYLATNTGHNRNDEALYWLAEAYYRSDLLNNSIDKYKTLIDLYPRSHYLEEAYYGLGWSHFRLKEFKKSTEVFERMIRLFPDSKHTLEVLIRQADGYYYIRDFNKAAEFYRRASRLAPANSDEGEYSSFQLAQALYRLQKNEEAITELLVFVRKFPRSPYAPYALYLTGWIRFEQKKYNEAIENFNFLTQAYPQSILVPRAYYSIGDAYYNQGDYDNAIANYKIVVESYPSSTLAPDALKSIQFCYMVLGKTDEAMKITDQYVESNPNSPFAPEFLFKKGEMFYTGKRFKDAITEYENFVQKFPGNEKNSEAIYWMAKSYLSLNDLENAEKTFKRVLTSFPKSDYAAQSLLEIALIKKQQADISAADSILKLLQKNYPDNPASAQAGFELASIKYSLGDTVAAIKLFREIAEKFKGIEYADQSRYRLAMHYRLTGKTDSALTEFSYLATNPDINANNPSLSAEAQYRIGEIYMRSGNCLDAIKSYKVVQDRFVGFEDWFTLSLLNLGECYERIGDYSSAAVAYEEIIKYRADDDYGKTAKRRHSLLKNLEKNRN